MRNIDQYIGTEFTWFTAVVEDVKDPDILNRVKVRCYGFHTQDKGILPTEKLPWATVMMPTTSASYQGVGGNHHLEVGSWVIGFFRDGPSAQDPMVMGSVATQENDIKDIPTEAQLADPTNKVYKSQAGHLIEIDNTSGAERLNVKHKTGTTVLIDKDGGVHINAINDIVTIDGNTSITGTLNVSDATTLQSTLDVTGNQTNAADITASGTVTDSGATLATHTHPGDSGGTTGTPS